MAQEKAVWNVELIKTGQTKPEEADIFHVL